MSADTIRLGGVTFLIVPITLPMRTDTIRLSNGTLPLQAVTLPLQVVTLMAIALQGNQTMTMKGWQLALVCLLGGGGAIVGIANPALAQVVADPSIGTVVTPTGTTYQITGGTTVGGRNLFHSFSRFDVPIGGIANFQNAATFANIFARVTGGTRSDIQGLIRSQGTANLFLMNPSGIVFGRTAQLNIGGSFVATTASAIQFPGGAEFSSNSPVNSQSSLLTVNPSAFLFRQVNVAPIQSNSANLRVGDGRSLLLLGGDVILDNSSLSVATVVGGRAELGGLAASGQVDLAVDGSIFRLSFPNDVLRGDVTLKNSSAVNVIAGGGGSIAVHARNLNVLDGSSLVAGIESGKGSSTSQAGDITLDATEIIRVDQSSFVENVVYPNAIGNSGNIDVTTGSLLILNGSDLGAFVAGKGRLGDIVAKVRDRIDIAGTSSNGQYVSGIFNQINAGATGQGGTIRIVTDSLLLTDGAVMRASTFGNGNAGNIDIQAQQVILRNSSISASIFGSGNAGNLTIHASELVDLSGIPVGNRGPGGLFAQIERDGTGHGGNLIIETKRLNVSNGSKVQVASFGTGDAGNLFIYASDINVFNTTESRYSTSIDADIATDVGATNIPKGNGGNLTIVTDRLKVTDGAMVSASSYGAGNAGNMIIHASEFIELSGDSGENGGPGGLQAQVNPGAIGHGGSLTVKTRRLSISNGSKVQVATFGDGDAGNLFIRADEIELFDTPDANNFFSTAINAGITRDPRFLEDPKGNGGTLTIETGRLSIRNGTEVTVDTSGQGNAGRLLIQAKDLVEVVGQNSFLTADVNSRATGRGGSLTIETRRLSIRDGGQVGSSTFGIGNAGDVFVRATDIDLVGTSANSDSSGLFSTSSRNARGNGGNLFIETRNLSLQDGAILTSRSRGQGNAGSITADISGMLQANNSTISTTAEKSSGGAISIAAGSIRLRGNSDIRTDIASGKGGGGNITLTANSIIALNDSDILAFARDGQGGNITLNTRAFFGQNYRPAPPGNDPATLDGNNRVDVNASGAVSGIITLPDTTFIQNSLTQLPQTFTDTSTLLASSCIVRRRQQGSSFTVTGSGGLPDRPDNPSTSPFPTGEVRSVEADRGQTTTQNSSELSWKIGDPIVEPQGVYQLPDGQLVMSRECP
jgi:filamentous hemagglutinin family protein